ncbi:TPR-like protein [Athelia psychrophila]|uniref:TPR-like protein n=1 Tax=Athelia psychrophila TaxID=1759441 RepID=A0A166XBJ6_9AGAM|nr:TPR-like protein [Fibularhizoctonia sp. CBS 109695]
MDSHQVTLLRKSVNDCSERGLFIASKWSSELLLSIPLTKRGQVSSAHEHTFSTSTPARSRSPRPSLSFVDPSPAPTPLRAVPVTPSPHPAVTDLHVESQAELGREAELEARDTDSLAVARACIGAREFLRAVHILKDRQSAKARFVSLYGQFLASEKKALQDWHKLDNKRHQPPVPSNVSLLELLEQVKNATNPWLLFLKALFLCGLKRREEAMESALVSIAGYPWNWSAWTLLGSCIGDGEELSSLLPLLPLPANHPLVQMFQVKTLNELHNPSDNELAICDGLLGDNCFPESLWVMSLRACVLYHLHDFGHAEVQFEKILQLDPYRIDDIDVFSNILYVTDNKLKLSRLAHEFLALDKDRPEVCCLVGNHYSLRAEHEKAVKYFRRATQLDHTYLSAWTLMGHEYVEMKNSHAAIEAYRRAVDVNRKDYRAWYGLGQAYELLNMHQYALHYYQHATALRPYDVRLWQAQGMCYEEIGRLREAIECLKRALIGADPHETSINLKLAKLHNDLEEFSEAAAYHRRVVEVCRANGRPVPDYAKSSLYVARNYLTTGGDIALAHEYLEQVAASNSEEVGQATELLKQAKNLITMDAGAHEKGPHDANPTSEAHKGGERSLATD